MKKFRTKLSLQRETLSQLNANRLQNAFGGEGVEGEHTETGPCCPALQAELRDARFGPRL